MNVNITPDNEKYITWYELRKFCNELDSDLMGQAVMTEYKGFLRPVGIIRHQDTGPLPAHWPIAQLLLLENYKP